MTKPLDQHRNQSGLWAEEPSEPCMGDFSDLSTYEVVVGEDRLLLTDFLLRCADSFDQQVQPSPQALDFLSLRNAFLRAGLAELKATNVPLRWVQVGLQVGGAENSYQELYHRIISLARDLLNTSTISNFFFMHKPPGLRLRFEVNGSDQSLVARNIYSRLDLWQQIGIVERMVPAVYEPEAHLFGGVTSMQSVHRLFTIDSLAWLDYHVLAGSERESSGPSWALSLLMLQALFSGLGIMGWEHIDVWEHIRTRTGRYLLYKQKHTEFEAIAGEIRSAWSQPDTLLKQCSPAARKIAENYRLSVGPETNRWCTDYFWTREASIGPREAAAFFAIFHWNRAGLSPMRQALLTEALASREAI